MKEQIIIDASGAPLGRVASYAAKHSLLGRKVIIVNCGISRLSGRREAIIREYRAIRKKGGAILKGPFFPSETEKIMKRTIRGMLNYKQQRGREALKRIICYKETPEEYINAQKIKLSLKEKPYSISLQELAKNI